MNPALERLPARVLVNRSTQRHPTRFQIYDRSKSIVQRFELWKKTNLVVRIRRGKHSRCRCRLRCTRNKGRKTVSKIFKLCVIHATCLAIFVNLVWVLHHHVIALIYIGIGRKFVSNYWNILASCIAEIKGALDNNGVAPFKSRIGINCKFLLLINFIISLTLPNAGSGITSNPLASFIF